MMCTNTPPSSPGESHAASLSRLFAIRLPDSHLSPHDMTYILVCNRSSYLCRIKHNRKETLPSSRTKQPTTKTTSCQSSDSCHNNNQTRTAYIILLTWLG